MYQSTLPIDVSWECVGAINILLISLPFGLRSAPGIFNTVADLFELILQNHYGVKDLLHYPDDYFTLGPAGTLACDSSIRAIQEASRDFGVPLAPDKCEGPTTCLIFLGIELDSMSMPARLPNDNCPSYKLLLAIG